MSDIANALDLMKFSEPVRLSKELEFRRKTFQNLSGKDVVLNTDMGFFTGKLYFDTPPILELRDSVGRTVSFFHYRGIKALYAPRRNP
jgi:hypothetical protein